MKYRVIIALAVGTVMACSRKAAEEAPAVQSVEKPMELAMPAAPEPMMEAKKERRLRGGAKGDADDSGADMAAGNFAPAAESEVPPPPPAPKTTAEGGGPAGGEEEAARTRSYFPETFLFEPLVMTDDAGAASLNVRVPDRLTTWRVLALAHSRDGAQAGTETSFVGTLPAYVDPIVPSYLYAGDEVKIPVQAVNTTGEAFSRTLRVTVSGAAKALVEGSVRIEAYSSRVENAVVRANKPGEILLRAQLGDKDAVERTIPVLPTGRPLVERRGGTLAAPRKVEIELPSNADPDSTGARLLVFPGALAILRAELGAATSREGAAADAYSLLLAGKGPALLRSLGGDVNEKAMRELAIVAGQRAIRHARSPSTTTAALFTEAALAHPESPVISRLGERLAATLASAQRPDGTFEGQTGWTLQRLLAVTAECVRAARATGEYPRSKQRAQRVGLLAEGAFERNIERVEDAYTSAAIAASGAVDGALLERLRKRVREKVRSDEDGAKTLPVEEGVVRGDGTVPSELEATALAVLALDGDREAAQLLPDLGARLLGAYDPRYGFGDARTNLVALSAVLVLFKEPLPSRVKVTLAIDDRPVAEGVLEGQKLKDVLAIEAPLPSAAGRHVYAITAEPPVAGLGYSLTLKTHVPWEKEEAESGLELEVVVPKELSVGRAVEVAIDASAPAGQSAELELSLPAGVQLDRAHLDQVQASGVISSYELSDGLATLELPPLAPGASFHTTLRAIPTIAGTLHSGASSIAIGSTAYQLPPAVWTVR
jgi:hypothetical protein